MTGSVSPEDAGITLIELVLAMALFALVALMGVQALNASLTFRDKISSRYDTTADLARAIALLRNDLQAIVPARFQPPGQINTRSALETSPDGTRLDMSLGGQISLSRNGQILPNALHRVIWRHDAQQGTLTRQSWPVLAPANDAVAGPEQLVMTGVSEVTINSYWPGMGWQPGVALLDPGPITLDDDSGTSGLIGNQRLPSAISVTLRLQSGGEIPLIETLQ